MRSSVFVVVLSSVISCKSEVYTRAVGDSVLLPCSYTSDTTITSPLFTGFRWSHNETFSTYVVLQTVGPYTPNCNAKYINRTSLNFSNGNLVVHDLTCLDEGEFHCEFLYADMTLTVASHTVHVVVPPDEYQVTIPVNNSVLTFAGNNCNDSVLELPESPYNVTLMTTVVSKPAVRILIEGNEVNQSSISLNPDCPEIVTTSISERYETSFSDPTINVTFEYNGLASEVCIPLPFQEEEEEEGMFFDFVLEIYIIIG